MRTEEHALKTIEALPDHTAKTMAMLVLYGVRFHFEENHTTYWEAAWIAEDRSTPLRLVDRDLWHLITRVANVLGIRAS